MLLCVIVNGKSPLEQPELTVVFERITDRIFGLLDREWMPHVVHADPVIWHRREHNEITDFIVNHTMERRTDWQLLLDAPFPDFNVQHANLCCHSDGGTRANSCSAAGWIVEARVIRGGVQRIFPLAMAGIFINNPISSFTAETLALDAALEFVLKLTSN